MNNIEPVFEFARRLELRTESGYSWCVLMPSDNPGENSLADVRDELEVALGIPVRTIAAGTAPVHDFVAAIMKNPGDIVLLSGLDEWNPENWSALDIQRSGLERKGAIILMLSTNSVLRLSNHAPNIRSFIGGSIFKLAPGGGTLTETERRHRITELENSYGMSSAQVIAKAESRNLELDPIFVEWLVLLGRGDLV